MLFRSQPLPTFSPPAPAPPPHAPTPTTVAPPPPQHDPLPHTDLPLRARLSGSGLPTRLSAGSNRLKSAPRSPGLATASSGTGGAGIGAGTSKPASPGAGAGAGGGDITALNGVVLPALESALHRRSYNFNLAQKAAAAAAAAEVGDQEGREAAEAEARRRGVAHENVKRLVQKAARLFREIDMWDEEAPVGMGGEVVGFLEGFLEEVLVRVEAEDE